MTNDIKYKSGNNYLFVSKENLKMKWIDILVGVLSHIFTLFVLCLGIVFLVWNDFILELDSALLIISGLITNIGLTIYYLILIFSKNY